MKFIFAFLATLFLAAPAWAVDVIMGSNGNLVFDPAEITILQETQFTLKTTCYHHTILLWRVALIYQENH